MNRAATHVNLAHLICLAFVLLGVWGHDREAFALEKYGRPLPEFEKTSDERTENAIDESLIGGYFLTGAFISNPSFAARPDNTGRVGMRYMLHAETDLYKKYVTFYSDQNFFSDRDKGWIILTEWDQTYGLTGTIDHWSWRVQYERDAPLDKSGLIQAYADGLVNYRIRTIEDWAWWRKMFPHNNLTAYAGAGWLYYNQTYFARPDNTGRALFRYVAHFDLDLYKQKFVLFGDANMFTDRDASNVVSPTELDWILGIAMRWRDLELSFYREQDRPLDRHTLIQEYWAVQLRFAFDVQKSGR
ncbi:hypothetical protein W02_14680 [Nitrospira sp. KM1]|uniref:hypothetical protein n=1 Tax=Nitrospira sp. KM1 TaxID=1936990 RepID=UPI0013A7A09C|nr:hypothetical protein [Nitrospira sp. KM1]BCA54328.1 hypothetical protein W02_14680 [Nitrospira sp. KM1]